MHRQISVEIPAFERTESPDLTKGFLSLAAFGVCGVFFRVSPLSAWILHLLFYSSSSTALGSWLTHETSSAARATGSSSKFARGLLIFDPRRVAVCMPAAGRVVSC